MSARIAAVRLGRTDTGDVVLVNDPRSAFLLCAQGSPIPAGFEVPDEWILGEDAAAIEPVGVEALPEVAVADLRANAPLDDDECGEDEPDEDEDDEDASKAVSAPPNKAVRAPRNKSR